MHIYLKLPLAYGLLCKTSEFTKRAPCGEVTYCAFVSSTSQWPIGVWLYIFQIVSPSRLETLRTVNCGKSSSSRIGIVFVTITSWKTPEIIPFCLNMHAVEATRSRHITQHCLSAYRCSSVRPLAGKTLHASRTHTQLWHLPHEVLWLH